MTAQKRELLTGVFLFTTFTAVLVVIFLPLFKDKNMMQYMDDLYNSISKGSVYYIPALQEESQRLESRITKVSLQLDNEQQAKEVAGLFSESGAAVELSGSRLVVSGKLGDIMSNSLEDADLLFHNRADKIQGKYGYEGKKAIYNWWISLKKLDKELLKLELFKEAKFVSEVMKRAIECSYNYYLIEPQKISKKAIQVVISLVFYVVYTVWFGFAIMYILMGLGFKLEH